MHDPMTQAFEIRQFWRRKNKWGYRPSFITIWHVDPERGGSDDSCDWFGRRMTKREHEWAKSLIENEYDNLRLERDAATRRAQDAEKQLAAIAMLVSIYERQREDEPEEGWPEGYLHPRQVLQAIGETIGQPCSICRRRHGSEVRHAAE